MTALAYIGVGANLGEPQQQVRSALAAIRDWGPGRASPLYRTEPLGDPDQPWYINAAIELETALAPRALLDALHELERAAGREPGRVRWAPRRLDLDLLLYGDVLLDEPGLVVPHPELARRRFVLEPLAALAPQAVDPRSGKRISELLGALDDPLRVEKLPDYTV